MTIERRHGADREAAIALADERHNDATGFGALAAVLGITYCIGAPVTTSRLALAGAAVALLAGPLIVWGGKRRAAKGETETVAGLERTRGIRLNGVTEWQFWAKRVLTATDATDQGASFWLFELGVDRWLAISSSSFRYLDVATLTFAAFIRVVVDGAGDVLSIESDGPDVALERRALDPDEAEPATDTLFFLPPEDHPPSPFLFEGDPTGTTRAKLATT